MTTQEAQPGHRESTATALTPEDMEVFRILAQAKEQYDRYRAEIGELPPAIDLEDIDYGYRNWEHPVSICMDASKHAVVE